MPYEFLESLFGTPAEGESPRAMTYAELETAIDNAEGLQVVNVAAGGFVPQADYDILNGQLTDANARLENYDPEWKTKLETAETDANTRIAETVKKFAINSAVTSAGTVDPDVVAMLIDKDKVTVDGDNATGITEQIETIRKEKPYLFADHGGKPYFGGSLGNNRQTGSDQDRVDARYNNNPWYRK